MPTWLGMLTLPTYVTLLRLLLVPFIIASFLSQNLVLAFILFTCAAVTDIIDGALARSLHLESELGGFLDPLADKALLVSTYACLAITHFPFTFIPAWFLWLVIIHEGVLSWCILRGSTSKAGAYKAYHSW